MLRSGPASRGIATWAISLEVGGSSGANIVVTIGMNYRVLPGKEEVFENAFNKVVHAMRNVAGHGQTHMFREINDSHHYLIVSQWNDRGAFDAFIASDTFRNVANWGKEQILAGRPSHEVYGE
jgi:heme-degrading monooxygenase HmoA